LPANNVHGVQNDQPKHVPGQLAVPTNITFEDSPQNRYIIVLKDNVSPDDIPKAYGLSKIHEYRHALNGVAVTASPNQIEKLKNDNRVLFVEQDKEFTILSQSLPTGIDRVDADLNPVSKIDGIDERVDADIAILDTGIEKTHPDLNVAGGANFVGTDPSAWNDGHGHGTHVAGTAAALDNDFGVVGVVPGARLWAVKVLSNTGSGTLIDIVEGIDWVTANSNVIDVVNMSLGGGGSDDGNCGKTNGDALHLAICNSVAKGVVYVVAAGNSATNAATLIPAAYDEVITVSAMADFDGAAGGLGQPTCRPDVDDTIADFSNYGQDVDIAAPGVCILSSWIGGSYNTISGTSMATPHVTGAAALYITTNGKPTDKTGADAVKQGLVQSGILQSDPAGFSGDPDAFHENLLKVQAISSGVDTISPVVSISSPTTGSTISTTSPTITGTASDAGSGVKSVLVTLDGVSQTVLGTTTWSVTTSNLGQGSHTIVATATDNAGNTASVTGTFTVDTVPTISITSPTPNSNVNGRVNILVSASDPSGISKVEIYIDNKLKATLTGSFSYTWNTHPETTGPHTITAKAYDMSGNSASADVTVYTNKNKK